MTKVCGVDGWDKPAEGGECGRSSCSPSQPSRLLGAGQLTGIGVVQELVPEPAVEGFAKGIFGMACRGDDNRLQRKTSKGPRYDAGVTDRRFSFVRDSSCTARKAGPRYDENISSKNTHISFQNGSRLRGVPCHLKGDCYPPRVGEAVYHPA
jgi:hypothetical protein